MTLDLSGWLVGVDIGANFTVGSGLVVGVVADIAWTDISGEDDDVLISPLTSTGLARCAAGSASTAGRSCPT